jgi:hypothetical protein
MEAAKLKLDFGLDKISAAKLKVLTKKKVTPKDLLGTWINCNKSTRGIVKVIIEKDGNNLFVHPYGSCHPNPCDWGKLKALAYAESVSDTKDIAFTASHKPGFKETIITGHLCSGCLIVETFNHFTDNSGRSNYYSRECFYRI